MKVKIAFRHARPPVPGQGSSSRIARLVIGSLFVLAIAFAVHIPPTPTLEGGGLRVGDIAAADVVVNKDVTVEDSELNEKNRRRALSLVVPVYEVDESRAGASQALIEEWLRYIEDLRRRTPPGTADRGALAAEIGQAFSPLELDEAEVGRLLDRNPFGRLEATTLLAEIRGWYERGILESKSAAPHGPDGGVRLVGELRGTSRVRLEDLLDRGDVERLLNRLLEHAGITDRRDRQLAQAVLLGFIPVNAIYSKTRTAAAEKVALAGLNPAYIHLKKGKVIVRRGDELSRSQWLLMRQIAMEENSADGRVSDFYLVLLILALLFAFVWKYFSDAELAGINSGKILLVMGLTLFTLALVYRASLFLFPLVTRSLGLSDLLDARVIAYAVPFSVGSLIVAFLFNQTSAVIFSLINAIVGGVVCGWNFKVALFVLAGNIAVAFGIEHYQRLKRSSILKAGFLWLLPVNVLTTLTLAVTESGFAWRQVLLTVTMGVLSALFSALIANFLIPLWEVLFKLVTDLKLVELTNLNLPIFRQMLEKAPGTYHHSQMVASLAESAAEDLGLSALLLRAMALYHDVGKIDNPQFFTENHSVYENPHPRLSPQESAKMIIQHIHQGVDQAEKLKLPHKVTQAILQHHGTKVVKYFWEKARQAANGRVDDLDENLFRYPGSRPREIEEAIIMLADQVEAASKSLSAPTDEEIRNVIEQLISTDIAEGQFAECEGLTFKALNIIASSFYNKLASIYHQRISYPGFNFQKERPAHD